MDLEFKFSKAKWIMDGEGVWLSIQATDRQTVQEFVQNLSGKD